MIKTIIFDLGGVLVPEKGKDILKEISRYLSVSDSLLSEYKEDYKHSLLRGEIKLIDFYSIVINRIGNKTFSSEELLKKHLQIYKKNSLKLNRNILNLIIRLKSKYSVVCLTNTEIEFAELNK